MATELYDLTIPVFLRGFNALSTLLEKGRIHADGCNVPHERLLEARLYEDMGPLTSQVQRASDAAKFTAVRLGQIDNVVMPDEEKSFDELQARIARTVEFLRSVDPAAINGREDADVELKTAKKSFAFKGRAYALEFALPNFYFHLTTAYAILRMKGVPVGKMDYLGGL